LSKNQWTSKAFAGPDMLRANITCSFRTCRYLLQRSLQSITEKWILLVGEIIESNFITLQLIQLQGAPRTIFLPENQV
jgi:hypothetical protein